MTNATTSPAGMGPPVSGQTGPPGRSKHPGQFKHTMWRPSFIVLVGAAIAARLTMMFIVMIAAAMLFLHYGSQSYASTLVTFLLMMLPIAGAPPCALTTVILAIAGGVLRIFERERKGRRQTGRTCAPTLPDP